MSGRRFDLVWVVALWAVVITVSVGHTASTSAATAQQAHDAAVTWFERNQNSDGSWGSGPTRTLTTAEAVNALARAGRTDTRSVQRAIAWLDARTVVSVDYQARIIRALAAAGTDVQARANAVAALASTSGWGPVNGEGVTAYDSALALGALDEAGVIPLDPTGMLFEVLGRKRGDFGFGGDDVPFLAGAPSDLTTTAEVVRALSGVATAIQLAPPLLPLRGISPPGAALSALTRDLEVAARLTAIHAVGQSDTILLAELLQDARLTTNGVWSTDPFVNALGLLALVTQPGASLVPAPRAPMQTPTECLTTLTPIATAMERRTRKTPTPTTRRRLRTTTGRESTTAKT